jgi:hypothetical protein
MRDMVRIQVLTAASMKIAVFWVVVSCSLTEDYRRFRGACRAIALMMEASSTSETSTRRNKPENSHLHERYGSMYGHKGRIGKDVETNSRGIFSDNIPV